ncbi:MAG: clostripain-related cysteine peptidase [Marinilabiliaceae bacterium]|nr:clostripain-related cysteine peptidase [Marinilabiliaceae bacterium]
MKKPLKNIILALLSLMVLLFSCQKDSEILDSTISTNRTILVYLGVDNDFRAEAAQKINILINNWDKSFDGNLFVYADTGKEPVLLHIYYDQQRATADTIDFSTFENSANPTTLTEVLNKIKEYRPANSYGMVVLSHGTGWLPAEMSKPDIVLKSVILDTTTDDNYNYMELSDFADAIPYKLDFIVFDACFMASVEVCYELKDKAEYIVASPAEVLVPGFVYSSMMRHLLKKQPDLISVAEDFFQYYNNQSDFYRSATVSVIKTSQLDDLIPIFKQKTTSYFADETELNEIQTFGYGTQKIYFDLGNYLNKIAPENTSEIEQILNQCVIYKANTPYYYSAGTRSINPIQDFSGLSIYIQQEQYPKANQAYRKLRWSEGVGSSE